MVRDDERAAPERLSLSRTQPGTARPLPSANIWLSDLAGRHRLDLPPEGARRSSGQRSSACFRRERRRAFRRSPPGCCGARYGDSTERLVPQPKIRVLRVAGSTSRLAEPQPISRRWLSPSCSSAAARPERRRTAILERPGMAFPVDGSRGTGGIAGQFRQPPRRVTKGAEIEVKEGSARRRQIFGRRREVPDPHRVRCRTAVVVQHSARHRSDESNFRASCRAATGLGQVGEDAEVMKRPDGMGQMERFGQVVGGQRLALDVIGATARRAQAGEGTGLGTARWSGRRISSSKNAEK